LPARAVPGVRWNGDVHDWRLDPSHYGAIHFHDDDLVDAGWDPSFMLDLPVDIPSGVYALRLRTSTSEDYVPFFVVPGPQTGRADVAYLAPTVTYRAYANARLTARPDRIFGSGAQQQVDNDRFLFEHPRVGLGTYERHSDGSGVMFSSHLRPVLNLKPKGGVWSFTADTNVTAWLQHTGVPFDVLTDDVLHAEGAALLEPYRVILTGTHPEYWTTPMLDALEAYLAGGGRLLYLGANGFYWRTSFHDAAPGTIEVRRAEDGARAWIAEPGEYHHESTGELGGLWRRLGRPPNRLVGVGFAAQGFTTSGHYRRSAGWSDPLVGFATEGLSEAEVFGDHGVIGGGAAGQEIDRYDRELGSPAHAVVLASSEDLPDDMLLTKEELFATGFPGAEIRADVVFVTGPCGGAVFSVGSIAWAASLATNGYDNDLAKLTDNVLRRFVDPAPLLPSVDSPTD
jgi:N,N-dimethylformamidase